MYEVKSPAEALDGVMAAVKRYHEEGVVSGAWQRHSFPHHGKFEHCNQEPCRGVLQANPEFVPADRRLDTLPGADSLRRHDMKETA